MIHAHHMPAVGPTYGISRFELQQLTALRKNFLTDQLLSVVREDEDESALLSSSSNGESSRSAMNSSKLQRKHEGFGHQQPRHISTNALPSASSSRYLPNGDFLRQIPPSSNSRFRSLNRPKLGVKAVSGGVGEGMSNLPMRQFSRSDWDLRQGAFELPRGHDILQKVLVMPTISSTDSANSVTEDEMQSDDVLSGGFFQSRRHHGGHYFSNIDLFRQPSNEFNFLKYAKASDFEPVGLGSPHVRIIDLAFVADRRSGFDKIMLRSNLPIPILHNVTFELFGGDTLAIMYTSEVEIRCLLSLLSGCDPPPGAARGTIEINGRLLRLNQFVDRVAFVSTEPLPTYLTAYEYIDYYTRFLRPATNAVPRKRLIDQLLHGLALIPLKSRLCKNLSRTEQQRLRLAAKMVLDTDILVCDNILYDMDLYDAAFVIDYVRDWAQRFNRVVIIATVPPTMELLTMFRKTAIMSAGKIIYFGETSSMVEYFESIGYTLPAFKNPCDYYVDLVTHDLLTRESAGESMLRIRTLADIWQVKKPSLTIPAPGIISPKLGMPSAVRKLILVYSRFWTLFFNDPWPRLFELIFAVIMSLFLGFVFFDIPRDRRSGIDDREGFFAAIMWIAAVMLAFIGQSRIHEDRTLVEHDRKSRSASTPVYVLAKVAFDVPFAVFASISLSTPAYFLVRLNPIIENSQAALAAFTLYVMINVMLYRYTAWLFAFAFKSRLNGAIGVALFFVVQLMTSGFIVHADDQIKPLGAELQNWNPTHLLTGNLLELVYLSGSRSIIFNVVEAFIGGIPVRPELQIDCLRKPVVATKLAVPVLTLKKCLRTSGSQALAFSGFEVPFSTGLLLWPILGFTSLVIFVGFLVFGSIRRRPSDTSSGRSS